MFILWNAKPIPLGQRIFHLGEAYFSRAATSTIAQLRSEFSGQKDIVKSIG
jgi:hypothetical protein